MSHDQLFAVQPVLRHRARYGSETAEHLAAYGCWLAWHVPRRAGRAAATLLLAAALVTSGSEAAWTQQRPDRSAPCGGPVLFDPAGDYEQARPNPQGLPPIQVVAEENKPEPVQVAATDTAKDWETAEVARKLVADLAGDLGSEQWLTGWWATHGQQEPPTVFAAPLWSQAPQGIRLALFDELMQQRLSAESEIRWSFGRPTEAYRLTGSRGDATDGGYMEQARQQGARFYLLTELRVAPVVKEELEVADTYVVVVKIIDLVTNQSVHERALSQEVQRPSVAEVAQPSDNL